MRKFLPTDDEVQMSVTNLDDFQDWPASCKAPGIGMVCIYCYIICFHSSKHNHIDVATLKHMDYSIYLGKL